MSTPATTSTPSSTRAPGTASSLDAVRPLHAALLLQQGRLQGSRPDRGAEDVGRVRRGRARSWSRRTAIRSPARPSRTHRRARTSPGCSRASSGSTAASTPTPTSTCGSTEGGAIDAGEYVSIVRCGWLGKHAADVRMPTSEPADGVDDGLDRRSDPLHRATRSSRSARHSCRRGRPGSAAPPAALAWLSWPRSEKQEAAFKFVAFGSTPENTAWWSQNTGYMPVRKSAVELPELKDFYEKNPNSKVAVEQLAEDQAAGRGAGLRPERRPDHRQGARAITINKDEVQPSSTTSTRR